MSRVKPVFWSEIMYKLGLVSISFRKHSCEEILSAMQKAGLSYIEWGSDVHAPKDDIAALEEIVNLQKKYSIECCSYGTYFRLGVTSIDELEGYINAAKILGTDILRLWCGDKDSEEYTVDEKEKLFDECKKAAKIAEKHNVKLCMECHNWTYTNTRKSAMELISEVASPAFRMYWQPNQFRTQEENIEYAKALSRYTEHIHVFNWKREEHFPLELGIDVWKKYLAEFEGERALLLEFMPDNEIESLKIEAEALRKIASN